MKSCISGTLTLLLAFSLAGCLSSRPSLDSNAPSFVAEDSSAHKDQDWILIDSVADRLTVFLVGRPPIVFENIAVGAAGVKEKQRTGDDVTPRGTYSVGWLQPHSKFVHFIGLTYPSHSDAERGYRNGVIDRRTYHRILSELERGQLPPQDTRLGGLIGIHGIGRGSPEIHRLANWTAGCIAVDNQQIRQLFKLLRIGMKVEIR